MKLTLKNILLWVGGLLAIVAFVMAFCPALKSVVEILGKTITTNYAFDEIYFDVTAYGVTVTKGAVLPFIGFILMGLGGLVALAASFLVKTPKTLKLFVVCSTLLVVVGAVFAFLTKAIYVNANKDNPLVIPDVLKLAVGPVLGGIFGIVSALSLAASQLLPSKK